MPTRTARDYAETALLEHMITGTLSDDDHTTNAAVALLNSTRACLCCGNNAGWAALAVAERILIALDQGLPGHRYHLTTSFDHDAVRHVVGLQVDRVDGELEADAEDAIRFLLVLAAGVCQGSAGLTARSSRLGGDDQVRAWSIGGGAVSPLSRAEVFNAYCTDAATGEPIPPCPQTEYCDAFILR
ncbi:hypothetical protein ABR738_00560 [Streptomyces sp. Edi4]|uniref:hypothetical protein n=1 Tax=Streptomyces sp. Edi4 TaxID=3162527 RepID=UPI0033057993